MIHWLANIIGCCGSKLGDHNGIDALIDVVPLLQNDLLELAVGTVPLLDQLLVLIEFAHQLADQITLQRQLLEQHVLRQIIHHNGLLHAVLEMVHHQLQGLLVPVNHSAGAAVGQVEFLLHFYAHESEFLDGLVDDAEGVLADD